MPTHTLPFWWKYWNMFWLSGSFQNAEYLRLSWQNWFNEHVFIVHPDPWSKNPSFPFCVCSMKNPASQGIKIWSALLRKWIHVGWWDLMVWDPRGWEKFGRSIRVKRGCSRCPWPRHGGWVCKNIEINGGFSSKPRLISRGYQKKGWLPYGNLRVCYEKLPCLTGKAWN